MGGYYSYKINHDINFLNMLFIVKYKEGVRYLLLSHSSPSPSHSPSILSKTGVGGMDPLPLFCTLQNCELNPFTTAFGGHRLHGQTFSNHVHESCFQSIHS